MSDSPHNNKSRLRSLDHKFGILCYLNTESTINDTPTDIVKKRKFKKSHSSQEDIVVLKEYTDVKLIYEKNATKVNFYVENILKHILFESEEKSGTITSTSRTVADQARVMYESYLNSDGLKMYGNN